VVVESLAAKGAAVSSASSPSNDGVRGPLEFDSFPLILEGMGLGSKRARDKARDPGSFRWWFEGGWMFESSCAETRH
jgi:hypothetical protein